MSFSLRYELLPSLPMLAWCARISFEERSATIRHGAWVETADDYFFEGAWDGPFSSGGFTDSPSCIGSGGKNLGDSLVFAAPSHTLERLFVVRGRELLVSNSIPFILAEAEDSIRPDYPFYHHDFLSIINGYDRCVQKVSTRRGWLEQYYFCNLFVGTDGSLSRRTRPTPRPFASYREYVDFLTSSLRGIFENARDEKRTKCFEPLATISSGYDSLAASVLARELGCREAVTFVEARENFLIREDSGRQIGEKLGLSVREYDRSAYKKLTGCPEAEFLVSGMDGQDVVMLALEDELPGRVLLTGFHGDKVWEYTNHDVGPHIVRGDTSGGSLSEFRLRVGFIHVPVPFLGCLQHRSIHSISHSQEMKNYLVPRNKKPRYHYNRPIPRRMAEQAGVPRDWFGNEKKAVTQPLGVVPRHSHLYRAPITEILTETSRLEFQRFLESHGAPRWHGGSLRFALMRGFYELNLRIIWRLSGLAKRLGFSEVPLLVPWRYEADLGDRSLLFHWAVEKMVATYRNSATDRSAAIANKARRQSIEVDS